MIDLSKVIAESFDEEEFYGFEVPPTASMQNLRSAIRDWVVRNQKKSLTQKYESGKYDAFFDAIVEEYKKDVGIYTFYRGITIFKENHQKMYDKMIGKKEGDTMTLSASLYPLQAFTLKKYKAENFAKCDEEEASSGDLGVVFQYDMPQDQDWRIAYYYNALPFYNTGFEHEAEVIIYVDDIMSGSGVDCSIAELYIFENGSWRRMNKGEEVQYQDEEEEYYD